jgi:hypothetical protein
VTLSCAFEPLTLWCLLHPRCRLDLLEFFRQECEERGATIIYATHVSRAITSSLTPVASTSATSPSTCNPPACH